MKPRGRSDVTLGSLFNWGDLMKSLSVLATVCLCLFAPMASAQFTAERVATGFTNPVFVTAPSDDPDDARLFVVEKGGQIFIIDDDVVLPIAFLDVSDLVSTSDEGGLLGLAFAPDYSESGLFYVNFTNIPGNTVIVRYSVSEDDPDLADTDSADPLMIIQQTASNHNGGHLAFSPVDGFLYIGMGDGGGDPDDAQDNTNPLGAMLRIDVSTSPGFEIPDSNPGFFDERIWSYGLRNPYRFSFDRLTGDLFIGDVGEITIEEVNFQLASSAGGENYGWPITEGSECNEPPAGCDASGHTLPLMEYRHDEFTDVLSVTGGYRYRGPVAALQGIYFFADFGGILFAATRVGPGVFSFSEITIPADAGSIGQVSGFGEDAVGNLYVVDFDGEIFKIMGGSKCPDTPLDQCRTAEGAKLRIKAKGPKKRKISWKWKKGEATDKEDFGDPRFSDVSLTCFYEGAPSALALQLVTPSGEGWKSKKKGFQYRNGGAALDGIQKMTLSSGAAGRAKLKIDAKGGNVPDPSLPMNLDGDVTVQLSNTGTDECWESRFTQSEIQTNDAERFEAKK